MPFSNVKIGLPLKFILLTTLLIVSTSLALGLFFLKSKEADYIEFLKQRGIGLSRTLAFNSEYAVLTQNTDVLIKLVQGISKEMDVAYCLIHDSQGKILAEFYNTEPTDLQISPMVVKNALNVTLTGSGTSVQPFPPNQKPLQGFDIATVVRTLRLSKTKDKGEIVPGYMGIIDQIKKKLRFEGEIVEEKIGTVRVGFSLASLHENISKIKRVIGMITLLVAVLGSLITIFLVQFIIRPIRRLVYGTRQIGRGDLNYIVKVNSRDEIGELAASFNHMTTFLRKSRDQVEEYRRNLEQMVEDRTQQLQETEAELIRSEKLAAIGELITGITHELNNKLTPILGYAQIFRTMQLDPKIVKIVDIIEESAVYAKKIVESLLKFSRTAPAQKIYINLNETLAETLNLIEPHLRKHNIELELKLDTHLPMTMADPGLVGQAFLNILNNAWQAMEDKGGKLIIQSVTLNKKILFSIQDTGVGIRKENLIRIFDPFFTTKEVGKGTGLGLSISYGIINKHEGKIHVESIVGEGTTFIIELPIKSPPQLEANKDIQDSKTISSKSGKILIIEDEQAIRSFLTDALESKHKIKTAINGLDAQEIIKNEKFDLYLMDLRMPLMDGRALYLWLQSAFPSEVRKVVFITGDSYDKNTQIFLTKVDHPQLSKPFQMDKLNQIISQVMEN